MSDGNKKMPSFFPILTRFHLMFISENLGRSTFAPEIVGCSVPSDLSDGDNVGYTPGHLHQRVDGHKQRSSSIYKH